VLIDRRTWRQHRPWVFTFLACTILASLWFFAEGLRTPQWPGGSSLPGLTFGVAGGLLILFEFLLWPRKKVRVWRIGRARAWMRAHIWLGLLTVPLLVYHSGLRLGGTLSTTLMVLLAIVIVSGVWGLAVQQFLPRRMLNDVPAETIYSQIDYLVGQMSAEARVLIQKTCGSGEGEEAFEPHTERELAAAGSSHLVVGAVRAVGKVQGKSVETRAPAQPVPGSEPLRDFFLQIVAPYLHDGARSDSPLRFPNRATVLFQDLKTKLPPAAHKAVDTLASFCDQRRQFDQQARLHFWLHNWLWIHLPLSIALVVLMGVHVYVALKYW
jgi:hypothetical protein